MTLAPYSFLRGRSWLHQVAGRAPGPPRTAPDQAANRHPRKRRNSKNENGRHERTHLPARATATSAAHVIHTRWHVATAAGIQLIIETPERLKGAGEPLKVQGCPAPLAGPG